MSESRGRGKLVISFALLKALLDLPEDAQIYGVNMSPNDLSREIFEVYVKHDGLPECPEGGEVLRVTPEYEKEVVAERAVFMGWGR